MTAFADVVQEVARGWRAAGMPRAGGPLGAKGRRRGDSVWCLFALALALSFGTGCQQTSPGQVGPQQLVAPQTSMSLYRDGDHVLAESFVALTSPEDPRRERASTISERQFTLVTVAGQVAGERGETINVPLPGALGADLSSLWFRPSDASAVRLLRLRGSGLQGARSGGGPAAMRERVRVDLANDATMIGRLVPNNGPLRHGGLFEREDGTLVYVDGEAIEAVAFPPDVLPMPSAQVELTSAGEHPFEYGFLSRGSYWLVRYRVEVGDKLQDLLRSSSARPVQGVTVTSSLTIWNGTNVALRNGSVTVYSGLLADIERPPIEVWSGPLSVRAGAAAVVSMPETPIDSAAFELVARAPAPVGLEERFEQPVRQPVHAVLRIHPGNNRSLFEGKAQVSSRGAAALLVDTAFRERAAPGTAGRLFLGIADGLTFRRRVAGRKTTGQHVSVRVVLEVRNQRDEPARVEVSDQLRKAASIELISSEPAATRSTPEAGLDLFRFDLEIPARSTATARYVVRYRK